MRIASIYGFRAYPPKGGNHLHAYQLIRHFQEAGHEVLTLGDDSVPGVVVFPRTPRGAREISNSADVVYVRIDANRLSEDPLLVELLETCRKPVVWEINAPANEALAFSWLGGNRRPGRGPARVVDQLRRRRHALAQYPRILKEERLRRRLARRAAAATCVSSALGRYAREFLGLTRVAEIPNGGDPVFNRPDGPVAKVPPEFDGRLKVLYAGSPIYPWQGLDVVADAMRICSREDDPIAFMLLMNQPPAVEFPRDNSVLLTAVPYAEVQEHIRAADVGLAIHPEYFWSRWGFHGSSMKMFDYMACGRPVVASNVGQLAEIVEPWRNGVLCENTGRSLREALMRLQERREDLPRMGREARRDIEERYNWKNCAASTLEIFDAVVRTPADAGRLAAASPGG